MNTIFIRDGQAEWKLEYLEKVPRVGEKLLLYHDNLENVIIYGEVGSVEWGIDLDDSQAMVTINIQPEKMPVSSPWYKRIFSLG